MINSYEVGAVFNIIDKASPTLKLLADQFNILDRAILRTQESLTRFSAQRFTGLGTRLKGINDQMAAIGVNSGKAFGGIDAGIQGSISRVQALKAEVTSLGAEMRGIGRMNMLPGGGGGGGRGPHPRPGQGGGSGGGGIHLGASQHGVHAYSSGDTFITAIAAGMIWKTIGDSAKEISHEVVQIQKLGISELQLKEVRKAAVAATQNIKGITQVDALGTYGAAYSIFGHQGALSLINPLMKFEQVAGNTSGNYKKAHEDVYSMIKGGDLLGRFNDETTHLPDAAKLNHFLDLGAKVMLATHGKVDAKTWFQLAQQGGPAISQMSDRGLMETAILAQMMGGPRTGTALTSLYQQMVGGKMTKSAAEHLHELGLVGNFEVGQGGHVSWDKGALDSDFTRALKDSPVSAIGIMKKALESHGFDTIEKQVPELFQMLGRATTQRIVHDLLRNYAGINAEVGRAAGVMGVGDAKGLQDKSDLGQAEHNLSASWKKFMEVLSEPGAQAMVTGLNAVSGFLDHVTELVRGVSPETLTRIAAGFAALSAVFVGAAFIALMGAIGVGGPLVLGLGALAAGIAAFWDVIKPTVSFNWEILKTGFGYVVSGIHALGAAFDWFREKLGGLFKLQSYDGQGVGGSGGRIIDAAFHPGGGANDNSAAIFGGSGAAVTPGAIPHAASANVSGFNPVFAGRLANMMAAAHAQGVPLSVFSGYRSQAHQDALFARSDHSGHWVARHSNHTRGIAADLRGDLGWAHRHASEYGLHFPMPWEKWHIEPQGSRGGAHVKPYSKPHGGGHQNLTVMLDGEVIHRSVVKHERRATEHSHQAPTFDGYHDFSAPDGQIWAA